MHNQRTLTGLFAALCFALSGLPAAAQYQKGFKISLPSAEHINGDSTRRFYIDSVYTSFPDTALIGTVYRSGLGKVVPAYIKDGVSANVTQCLFSHYPQLRPAHRPVRLRIDRLTYTEDPTQGYEIEAELLFLRQVSSGRYEPFYKANIDTQTDGFGRGSNIAEQFQRAIHAMNAYLNDSTRTPPYLDDYEIAMRKAAGDMQLDTATYAATLSAEDNLLTATQKRPGIYLTEKDLLLNQPALVGTFQMETRKNAAFATLLRPTKRRARYRFYGFCIDNVIYINANRYGGNRATYAQVQEVGRYLLWRDDYVTISEVTTRAAMAQFGLLGGLVSAAASNFRDCIAIDAQTGKLFNVTPEVLRALLADLPSLLTEYEAAEKPNSSATIYAFMSRLNQMSRHIAEKR